MRVFRLDLYDKAVGTVPGPVEGLPRDGIGAFAGPDFVAEDIAGYLDAWRIKRIGKLRLSIVR